MRLRIRLNPGNTIGAFRLMLLPVPLPWPRAVKFPYANPIYDSRARQQCRRHSPDEATVAVVTAGTTPLHLYQICYGGYGREPALYGAESEAGRGGKRQIIYLRRFRQPESGFAPTSRAYVYDPVANTWTAIAPITSYERH